MTPKIKHIMYQAYHKPTPNSPWKELQDAYSFISEPDHEPTAFEKDEAFNNCLKVLRSKKRRGRYFKIQEKVTYITFEKEVVP